jgi:thymidylate synthase
VVRELLWFLRGSTNINDLGCGIWDAWADEEGELGPIYGAQWRSCGGRGIDQIKGAVELLRRAPYSRRNVVSAWNVADLPAMKLPPCHVLFQLYVTDGRLDLQLYQRSADLALGVPFNIASYALLLTMLAREAALEPGVLVHTIGDAHVYLNHVEGLRIQLGRAPLALPRVSIAAKPLDELTFEDIGLQGYQHHPFIRFEVSV